MKSYRIYFIFLCLYVLLPACKWISSASVEPFPKCSNKNITFVFAFADTITCLDLSNQHLRNIPPEIIAFKNLKVLNLYNNRLNALDSVLFSLKKLEYLNISKNELTEIPDNISKFLYLKRLDASQNMIEKISPNIGLLGALETLDLWGNEVSGFPNEIHKLNGTLKKLDLRVIILNESQQQQIINLLPNTKIFFSESCNCN